MMHNIRTVMLLASLVALGGCAGCSLFVPEGEMTMEVIDEPAN